MERGNQWQPWNHKVSVLLQDKVRVPKPPQPPQHIAVRPKMKRRRPSRQRAVREATLHTTNQESEREVPQELGRYDEDDDLFDEQQKIFDKVVWHEHLDHKNVGFPITKELVGRTRAGQRHKRVPVMTAFGGACRDQKSRKVGGSKAYKHKFTKKRAVRPKMGRQGGGSQTETPIEAAPYAVDWDKELFIAKEYKKYLLDKRHSLPGIAKTPIALGGWLPSADMSFLDNVE